MPLLRRCVQGLCLALFLLLLLGASWPLAGGMLPPDLFLRLDPLVAALVPLVAREWLSALWPGLVVAASAPILGRLFCGWICPMGATLDLGRFAGRLVAGKRKKKAGTALPPGLRKVKYLVLVVMAAAAFAGVNLLFWGSPLALATRFWALLVHPLLLLGQDVALNAGRPLLEAAGSDWLAYAAVQPRRYDSLYFVLGFFLCLFVLERVRPRFWCRYLCPAGALLGLLARRPLWRRGVEGCVGCGSCVRACPQGALAADGEGCEHGECIACQSCVESCAVGGVRFGLGGGGQASGRSSGQLSGQVSGQLSGQLSGKTSGQLSGREADQEAAQGLERTGGRTVRQKQEPETDSGAHSAPALCALPSRRAFVGAAAAGVVLASVQYSGGHSLLRLPAKGTLWAADLIRPPASLPEPAFLDRCIRCGECMKVCPTNALQPTWFAAGAEGMFSPVLVSRIGPCEPECNACGSVCPTGAIRPLPLEEKKQAKTGTAVVNRQRCLAWAEERSCMVCQEVCPYGSVKIVSVPGVRVPAPVVHPERCFGCGFCENHCPTRLPSIAVEPLNALRLESGSYSKAAQEAGLSLSTQQREMPYPEYGGGPEYGDGDGGLPPGFSE